MTDLLKDGLHESLSELHDHVLVSKGHLQIHLGETGLSVTSCVLHRTCTILLPMAVSLLCQCSLTVQLDSEGYDIPDQPLSWIICMSAGCNFVELACRSIGQNTRLFAGGSNSLCSFAFATLPHQQYHHHHHVIVTCKLVRLRKVDRSRVMLACNVAKGLKPTAGLR